MHDWTSIYFRCQFGNIVLWDLKSVLECDEEMDTGHPACVKLISEHTGIIFKFVL